MSDIFARLEREIEEESKPKRKAAPKKATGSIQNVYEKIPKNMILKSENPNVHLHNLQLPFRMCVVAPSGSGKTNFIVDLIAKFSAPPKGTFNTITVITRNADEPLYNFLKTKDDGIVIKEGLSNLPDLDSYDKELQHLVVLDDLVLQKNQERIASYYIRCRKLNVSVAYLSQSYFAIPKIIRQNSNYLILLKLSGSRELQLILSEGGLGIEKEQLLKMYEYATNEKFSPLIVDYDKDQSQRFRKGYHEILSANQ